MPDSVKFYLDEMISPKVARGLRNRGVDVLTTGEAGNLSQSDELQLEYASSDGRVLVTEDDDFLILIADGLQHKGIAFVHRRRSIGQTISGLYLIHELMSAEEMSGNIEFI